MIKKGDELTVNILELSSEGKGISKLEDGFVIFSTNTLPGDIAVIKVTRKKSSYAEAKLITLLKESPFRIPPKSSYFGICGGCKIQNFVYEKQLEFKKNVVINAFERIGGFKNLSFSDIIRSDEIFFYRNKMEYSFSDDVWVEFPEKEVDDIDPHRSLKEESSDNEIFQKVVGDESGNISAEDNKASSKFALGLHVPKFHSKIVNIEECFLQSETSNRILNFTREFFKSRSVSVYSTRSQSGFLRFLIIRESKNTNNIMVNLITYEYNKDLIYEYSDQLLKKVPQITTLINSTSQKKAQVAVGEKEYILFGEGFIYETLKNISGIEYKFKISPQSFFQTNTIQAQKLFDTLILFSEFNKNDNVLDLYCGTGSISISVSGLVNKVLGAELVQDAISDAVSNAEINNVDNVEFVCSDIKEFLMSRNLKQYNKLILDPPRSGLHPKISEILSQSDFEKIVYVSCNPHTQARDLQIICSSGKYIVDKIQPVDMFPHTYHVENVVSLIKS